ncbi:unnamed protein product, partial [Ilex paraguariensis]
MDVSGRSGIAGRSQTRTDAETCRRDCGRQPEVGLAKGFAVGTRGAQILDRPQ